ncbi:MAG: YXWGXW repeat-containing protein [Proteobacteria bacterium]|nr:YXWGXW repeat-containing protein [Pseudomonadota bacterium]
MNVAGFTHRTSRARIWLARSLVAVAAATALSVATTPTAHAGIFVSVNFAPPALPVYVQPAIPGPGYIWTPGYWAYDAIGGYYWVPGTWVLPPYTGALWTPGYWAWGGGVYAFHPGYWGLHVGYYGGINYGFGYVGIGYVGGYWGPRGFYYNREVNHITNVNITNVYNKTVTVNNYNTTQVSYNGGPGGVSARATPEEMRYANEPRTPAIAAQTQHQVSASHNTAMRASVNHGNPAIAATSHPNTVASHGASPTTRAGFEHAPMRSASYAPHAHATPNANGSAPHTTMSRTSTMPQANYVSHNAMPHNTVAHTPAPAMAAHVAPPPHAGSERAEPHSTPRAPAHEGHAEHR